MAVNQEIMVNCFIFTSYGSKPGNNSNCFIFSSFNVSQSAVRAVCARIGRCAGKSVKLFGRYRTLPKMGTVMAAFFGQYLCELLVFLQMLTAGRQYTFNDGMVQV